MFASFGKVDDAKPYFYLIFLQDNLSSVGLNSSFCDLINLIHWSFYEWFVDSVWQILYILRRKFLFCEKPENEVIRSQYMMFIRTTKVVLLALRVRVLGTVQAAQVFAKRGKN